MEWLATWPRQDVLSVAVVSCTLILVLITGYYAYVTAGILRATRAGTTYDVLYRILSDYRSAEMLLAVGSLHSFHRDHPTDFVEEYMKTKARDDGAIKTSSSEQRLSLVRDSLHNQRRLVSHYYQLLGGLRELKVLPDEVLDTYFGRNELAIVKDVILPIEAKLVHDKTSPAYQRTTKLLESLVEHCSKGA